MCIQCSTYMYVCIYIYIYIYTYTLVQKTPELRDRGGLPAARAGGKDWKRLE